MSDLDNIPNVPLILHSRGFGESAALPAIRGLLTELREITRDRLLALLGDEERLHPLVVIVDDELVEAPGKAELPPRIRSWRSLRLVSITSAPIADDPTVPDDKLTAEPGPGEAPAELARLVRGALREAAFEARNRRLERELRVRSAQIHELNRIGVALSTERDHERLLDRILHSLRELTGADAGSLFLSEEGPEGQKLLRFTVAQNDSIETPALVRFTMPMNTATVAGYVACSGEPLNIPDVYNIPEDAPYSFNKGFDQRTGYRTQSMLVLPMRNQLGDVMGVVQLINKRGSQERLPEPPHLCRDIIPFDDLATELSTSLTSQAAVCIENNVLYEGLQGNIAELKDTQAQLVQSEKLASLGQLTAGVAHEINNPLAFTRNNTHLAAERINSAARRLAVEEWLRNEDDAALPDRIREGDAILKSLLEDQGLRDDVKEVMSELSDLRGHERVELMAQFMDYVKQRKDMEEGTLRNLMGRVRVLLDESFIGLGRVAEIVRGLRNFSRLDEATFQDADIDEGIRQTMMILREPAREQSVNLIADLGLTRTYPCFPAKLNQVILNLVNNAIDASPKGSDVTVITRERNGFVEIFVRDSGHGIPEHIRTKIFDPFFTTKPVGKGTGLGLSISYRIIQEHQGKIAVDPNENGVGVVFSIRIPVRQPEQAEGKQAAVAEVQ
ncbi:MAG: GAF domain-containing sensor histidine kinase [Myxococcales bacterium]|nr:GAF domain-containing sensor histidine kinase [Myxococcales bacterium]